jgi:hypothetical protein
MAAFCASPFEQPASITNNAAMITNLFGIFSMVLIKTPPGEVLLLFK